MWSNVCFVDPVFIFFRLKFFHKNVHWELNLQCREAFTSRNTFDKRPLKIFYSCHFAITGSASLAKLDPAKLKIVRLSFERKEYLYNYSFTFLLQSWWTQLY